MPLRLLPNAAEWKWGVVSWSAVFSGNLKPPFSGLMACVRVSVHLHAKQSAPQRTASAYRRCLLRTAEWLGSSRLQWVSAKPLKWPHKAQHMTLRPQWPRSITHQLRNNTEVLQMNIRPSNTLKSFSPISPLHPPSNPQAQTPFKPLESSSAPWGYRSFTSGALRLWSALPDHLRFKNPSLKLNLSLKFVCLIFHVYVYTALWYYRNAKCVIN